MRWYIIREVNGKESEGESITDEAIWQRDAVKGFKQEIDNIFPFFERLHRLSWKARTTERQEMCSQAGVAVQKALMVAWARTGAGKMDRSQQIWERCGRMNCWIWWWTIRGGKSWTPRRRVTRDVEHRGAGLRVKIMKSSGHVKFKVYGRKPTWGGVGTWIFESRIQERASSMGVQDNEKWRHKIEG